MKIAIYRTDTGEIVETRESSSGSIPPLKPLEAWCHAGPECHPDTHMADPMGLQITERPLMPVSIVEEAGHVVIDGVPDGADVIFHGKRHGGKRKVRAPLEDGERHHLFIQRWPYQPVKRMIGEQRPKAEREARRRQKGRAALDKIKDPTLRATLAELLDLQSD